jgi:hypothetical protein
LYSTWHQRALDARTRSSGDIRDHSAKVGVPMQPKALSPFASCGMAAIVGLRALDCV